MKVFAKLVDGFAKSSILDVYQGSEYASVLFVFSSRERRDGTKSFFRFYIPTSLPVEFDNAVYVPDQVSVSVLSTILLKRFLYCSQQMRQNPQWFGHM